MIAVDNTFLSLLFHPKARPPLDPATGRPIIRLDERIDDLVERWRTDRERILIPTPALSEFLYLAANDGPLYLAEIDSDSLYRVAGFDQKAAIELAAINLQIKRDRSKSQNKQAEKADSKAKINFDKQIVAIAIANEAAMIYSDDEGVEKFAGFADIPVTKTWELPLPRAVQIPLPDPEQTAKRTVRSKAKSADDQS